ncbi:hypothetical protein K1X12_14640 [Hyphomonas sp. WL0036]|uniref:hypothetical protein n=1 Tax=Hyphomonas sediminis TaxID=2866160 RepID=UPI001C813B2A|nr:hypothetical protein [Hyphomonas sediminis]MBY9068146.1 hypothetical protein [Hyphomonas sediminis]
MKFLHLLSALSLLGFLVLAGADTASAQSPGAKPPETVRVWRESGDPPGLEFNTDTPRSFFDPVPYAPSDEPAWSTYEDALNRAIDHLRGKHVFGPPMPEGQFITVMPISRSGPTGGNKQPYPSDLGRFFPPDLWLFPANYARADVNWVRTLSKPAKGPTGQEFLWHDPYTMLAWNAAQMGQVRIADKVRPMGDAFGKRLIAFDPAGRMIFNSAGYSLALVAAEALTDPRAAPEVARLDLYHYASAFKGPGDGGDDGPTPTKLLTLGQSWTTPWMSLPDKEDGPISSSALSGIFNTILAHQEADSFVKIFMRPWPMPAGTKEMPGRTAWLDWLDDGIRASGTSLTKRKGYTAVVAERGLAGAYVTALSDGLGLARRVKAYAPEKPLPSSLALNEHVENIFAMVPCKAFKVDLKNAVHEQTLTIPEISTRCIQLEYTGPTYGSKGSIPPVSISAYTAGFDAIAYDTLHLATSTGEKVGLGVEDATAKKAVKMWTIPFEPDVPGGDVMTLAFANVAPVASATRTLDVRLSFGISVTGAVSTLSTYVNTAPPNADCSAQKVSGPPLAGAVPYPTIASPQTPPSSTAGASGDLADLIGFTGVANKAAQNRELPAAFDIAALRSTAGPDLKTAAAKIENALDNLKALTTAPPTSAPQLQDLHLDFTNGSSLARPGALVGEINWIDPSLPVFPKTRGAMGPDDRRDDPHVLIEGTLSLQVASETRLRGRIDLTPTEAVSSCEMKPEGKVTIVFDQVAALPQAPSTRLVMPQPIAVVPPEAWAGMPEANRAKLRGQDRYQPARTSQTGASRTDGCSCSCEEYADPVRAVTCKAACDGYAVQAPLCAIESAVVNGVSRGEAVRRIEVCSRSCPELLAGDPICRAAMPELAEACQSDGLSDSELACYLDLMSAGIPDALRPMLETNLRKSVAAMDEATRKKLIRDEISSRKKDGQTCN